MDQSGSQETSPAARESSEGKGEAATINLAMLVDSDYLDRFGSIFGHLLIGLVDELVNVTVVCPDGQALAEVPTGPAKIIEFKSSPWPWRHRRRLDDLARTLESGKIGLIHSCCGTQAGLACELARQMDRPYVVSVTGLLQKECYWPVDRTRCRALIAISQPIRDMLLDAYHGMRQRIHLVRPGCFWRARAQRSAPERIRTLVSAGFFDRQSGYDVLLRALARLAKTEIDFHAFLFGAGPQEYALHRWARRSNLGPRVTFMAPLSRWHGVLDDADLYVQPGALQRLHGGPYEAMARGCPVVSTPDTAFDLVVEGQTGMLFPRGDEQALVEILSRWLGDREALAGLSERTGEAAREQLSLHRSVSELIEIYRMALDHAET